MKTLKLKNILFGLMTMMTVVVVMTSCEQELPLSDLTEIKDDNSHAHLEHENYEECGECQIEFEYTTEVNIKLPFAKNKTNVMVGVKDGIAYYQGDIILGKISDILEKGVAKDSQRWPNSTIPYEISSDFSSTQETTINDAIANVNANTNLCLVPRTNEPNYVRFAALATGVCASSIGMVGGEQNISLGANCSFGTTIHEILHAAGVWHEQCREDRDDYITVHIENVIPTGNYIAQFDQQIDGSSDYGPYDYGSVMHYGNYAFSDNGLPTITTIPPGIPIGQRNGLSPGDISTINAMYSGCACPTPTASDITYNQSGSLIANLIATPYAGTLHQFRYRPKSTFGWWQLPWQTLPATTSANSPFYKRCSTQYDVQLRVRCQNGWSLSWGEWSPTKVVGCIM